MGNKDWALHFTTLITRGKIMYIQEENISDNYNQTYPQNKEEILFPHSFNHSFTDTSNVVA